MTMHYSDLLGGFRLFGDSLGGITGGEVDFKVVGGFEVGLVVEFPLVLVNVKGLGGAEALRGPIDSNRSFPVMSNLRIFLAACETLRHILDFRSSVSCFGLG